MGMVLKWEQNKLWADSYWFDKCYRNASTRAVKSGQLGGNADTFIKPIFSADNLVFLVNTFLRIFLYKNIVFYW